MSCETIDKLRRNCSYTSPRSRRTSHRTAGPPPSSITRFPLQQIPNSSGTRQPASSEEAIASDCCLALHSQIVHQGNGPGMGASSLNRATRPSGRDGLSAQRGCLACEYAVTIAIIKCELTVLSPRPASFPQGTLPTRPYLQALLHYFVKRISPNVKFSPNNTSSISAGCGRRRGRKHHAPVDQPSPRLPVAQRPPCLCNDRPSKSRLGHHPEDVQVRRFRSTRRRRLERAGDQRRKDGTETRQETGCLQGLSKDPRSQGHRRGHGRHARPLAHEDRGRSDVRGKRRLLRKTAHADHRRRKVDREGR